MRAPRGATEYCGRGRLRGGRKRLPTHTITHNTTPHTHAQGLLHKPGFAARELELDDLKPLPPHTITHTTTLHTHFQGLLHKPGFAARELELDDLKRMPYMTAAAKEAMRMFPVVR